ncbi:MAG: PKD domain-containing protein, partial [Methylotenera sp.]
PYTLTVTGYSTNVTDGCTTGNETVYEFPFIVAPPPVPDFINTTPGCPADSVRFTETTLQLPYPTYKFWWDFGEPSSGANNNSTLRNPVHAYANPGTYSVKFGNITTAGCISDTISKTVVVPILVNATITGTTTLCQNATQPTITFTGTNGVLPYTFTYNINGGAAQTISTTGTNTSVTLLAPTNIVGPFAYNLVKVENANPAFCSRVITGQTATVTVNPLPTATITGAINVCQNTTAPLITFTGANATAPYTFTYNINGGTNQTITTTSGNSVTLAAPTTSVGTFNYNLVSVVDASTTLCSNTAVGSAQVVVQATPTATITGTISLCKDAAAPSITFNGVNGIAPFTFTYNINGGATQTVSTIAPATSIT